MLPVRYVERTKDGSLRMSTSPWLLQYAPNNVFFWLEILLEQKHNQQLFNATEAARRRDPNFDFAGNLGG